MERRRIHPPVVDDQTVAGLEAVEQASNYVVWSGRERAVDVGELASAEWHVFDATSGQMTVCCRQLAQLTSGSPGFIPSCLRRNPFTVWNLLLAEILKMFDFIIGAEPIDLNITTTSVSIASEISGSSATSLGSRG